MRKAQLKELFFSILFFVIFVLSMRLISQFSNQQTSDYTTGWGNVGWSILLTVLVLIPSVLLSVFFAIAAILNEIKIYNEKRAKKI
jgi:uncharacterized membrane protein (DUF485 family)